VGGGGGGGGGQFSRLLAAEMCASAFIVGVNAEYTIFRVIVKAAGYPLHSPVSPSLPLPPFVTVCHHISTGVYLPSVPSWNKFNFTFYL